MEYRGETLSWARRETWLEVELHRAPLNEIGVRTLEELELLVRYLHRGADGARALVLHSSRPGFCAGADLRALHAGFARPSRLPGPLRALATRARVGRFVDRIHGVMDALDQAPLVTIAAVNGVCFGGGFELALTADLRIADRTARFCFPELRLGIVPGFGGIPRLAREVGNGLVRDLLLTGRSLGAQRAAEVGLLSQLVAKGEALDAARRTAAQVSKLDAEAAARGKAFAKPLPAEALRREKALFLDLVVRPEVFAALDRFVADTSVRPYLPSTGAPRAS